ncbi:questin oxidase family protein [Leptospira sarikeiensis]|uniref:Questin oxidase family protein n=1 Tax=Leptospira sarikeiensis TaxID=2484943 RepID=A0A4R9KAB6_9LEPT|nr:questin oxidase family protein [Leptospira sarikeiensis]TGL63658.1 questin oxidase family protein [Leptospira sarikeiensis]
MNEEQFIEQALEHLDSFGPDLKNGLSNHAPMVCEALYSLGKAEAIPGWLEKYGNQFIPKKKSKNKIDTTDWKNFLGEPETYPEWEIFFSNEIETGYWKQVLAEWVVKLAPGICADATHGVIRTGHAVRNLVRKETKLRKKELASGLAVWASNYLELPTSFDALLGLNPEDAIQKVEFAPNGSKNSNGTIVTTLQNLAQFETFAPTIGYLDVSNKPEDIISDLAETFSKVALNNVEDTLSAIVFVHSVTSVSALRSILPFLNEPRQKSLLRYSWQSSAALFASYGKRIDLNVPERFEKETKEEMIEEAIKHGDEHVIKFTEACLKEYGSKSSSAFIAAIQLVRKHLDPI